MKNIFIAFSMVLLFASTLTQDAFATRPARCNWGCKTKSKLCSFKPLPLPPTLSQNECHRYYQSNTSTWYFIYSCTYNCILPPIDDSPLVCEPGNPELYCSRETNTPYEDTINSKGYNTIEDCRRARAEKPCPDMEASDMAGWGCINGRKACQTCLGCPEKIGGGGIGY